MTISQVADDTAAFSLYPATLEDDSASVSVSSTSDDRASVREVEDEYYGRNALRASLRSSSSSSTAMNNNRSSASSSSRRSSRGANFIEMVGTTTSSPMKTNGNNRRHRLNLSESIQEGDGEMEMAMRNRPQESQARSLEHKTKQSSKRQEKIIDNSNRSNNTDNSFYNDWSFEDINLGISRATTSATQTRNKNTTAATSNKSNNNNDAAIDDLAWRIIKVVLKGWCFIWVLFAILVISAEVFSPKHSTSTNKNQVVGTKQQSLAVVDDSEEQKYLELSEQIITACSYTNFNTEKGRMGCQKLCHDHLCCFIDDDNEEYGCVNDPNKMCGAYAGCESLVFSEEDVVIFDMSGGLLGEFEEDDSEEGEYETLVSTGKEESQSTNEGGEASTNIEDATAQSTPSSSLSSELQLIQQVVSSVCSPTNLHSSHGLRECATLCNPSMCCFNPTQILTLNPKMDLILKLEGVGDDILDRSAMGTCIEENDKLGDEEDATTSIQNKQSPFCEVHAGCKNILLLGAHHTASNSHTEEITNGHGKHTLIFTSTGVYDSSNTTPQKQTTGSGSGKNDAVVTDDQERMLVTVCTLFGLIIATTAYLLVFKREGSTRAAIVGITMSLRHGVSSRSSSGTSGSSRRQQTVGLTRDNGNDDSEADCYNNDGGEEMVEFA